MGRQFTDGLGEWFRAYPTGRHSRADDTNRYAMGAFVESRTSALDEVVALSHRLLHCPRPDTVSDNVRRWMITVGSCALSSSVIALLIRQGRGFIERD